MHEFPLSAKCFVITPILPTCLQGSKLLLARDTNVNALYLNFGKLAIGNNPCFFHPFGVVGIRFIASEVGHPLWYNF